VVDRSSILALIRVELTPAFLVEGSKMQEKALVDRDGFGNSSNAG